LRQVDGWRSDLWDQMDVPDGSPTAPKIVRRGYHVSHETVHRLLSESGYVLRTNRKRLTEKQDLDRDRQMRYAARVP
jgi:hypothetical protein